jgi:hypothetical protein
MAKCLRCGARARWLSDLCAACARARRQPSAWTEIQRRRTLDPCVDAGLRIVEEVHAAFPALVSTQEALPHEAVEFVITWPAQEGLRFWMALSLHGDSLVLNAGTGFTAEWFPCDRAEVATQCAAAVRGLLSGQYRIRERVRGGKVVGATLEQPQGGLWEAVYNSAVLHWPWPRAVENRILQNR